MQCAYCIKKLKEGQYDAIILAAAGLERLDLDLSEFTVEQLETSEFVPAPAQGVLFGKFVKTIIN